jgi:hypothetical protein
MSNDENVPAMAMTSGARFRPDNAESRIPPAQARKNKTREAPVTEAIN